MAMTPYTTAELAEITAKLDGNISFTEAEAFLYSVVPRLAAEVIALRKALREARDFIRAWAREKDMGVQCLEQIDALLPPEPS